MVIYDLQCNQSHNFEAWFKDQNAFEKQRRLGLVQCPICGISQVKKLPSACHIKGSAPVQPKPQTPPPQEGPATLQKPKTDNVDPIVFLKTVQKYVQDNFKNVGKGFTDQAIQMQKGEIPREPIHGTATKNDIERLDNEEVSYIPLPKLDERFKN